MFGTFMLPSLADIVPSPYLPVYSTRCALGLSRNRALGEWPGGPERGRYPPTMFEQLAELAESSIASRPTFPASTPRVTGARPETRGAGMQS